MKLSLICFCWLEPLFRRRTGRLPANSKSYPWVLSIHQIIIFCFLENWPFCWGKKWLVTPGSECWCWTVAYPKLLFGVNSRCRCGQPYGARCLAADWELGMKQVEGTEIKDPLRLPYVTMSCASLAVVKCAQFDVSIRTEDGSLTRVHHRKVTCKWMCNVLLLKK